MKERVVIYGRVIDQEGYTLDTQLCKAKDSQSIYSFMKKLVKQFEELLVLTTDTVLTLYPKVF